MRITGVAVLSALLLAAAGCGGDDEPPPLPPVTAPVVTMTAPAPAPAPAPSVSAFPETPQGAAAFARYLYGQIALAYIEKNPERLRPLFAPNCVACGRYISTLESLRSGEAQIERGESVLLGAEAPGGPGPQVVVVRERAEKVTFRDRNGKVTAIEPAGEYTSDYTLTRSGDSWQLAGQTIVKS